MTKVRMPRAVAPDSGCVNPGGDRGRAWVLDRCRSGVDSRAGPEVSQMGQLPCRMEQT